MKSVIPKPRQHTTYIVWYGSKRRYCGNSVREAYFEAKAGGERASITFKTTDAAEEYLHYRP